MCNSYFDTIPLFKCLEPSQSLQYSPKIMHAQEVAQEVLAPQEHASGQKKLNCATFVTG